MWSCLCAYGYTADAAAGEKVQLKGEEAIAAVRPKISCATLPTGRCVS